MEILVEQGWLSTETEEYLAWSRPARGPGAIPVDKAHEQSLFVASLPLLFSPGFHVTWRVLARTQDKLVVAHDLDEDPVGAFLFWKDHSDQQIGYWQGCGPWYAEANSNVRGQSNVKPYPDIDEWGRMVHFGFRYFGLNQQPALALSPVCGTASAVECPQGFVFSFGRCTAHDEGYLPPDIGEVPTP